MAKFTISTTMARYKINLNQWEISKKTVLLKIIAKEMLSVSHPYWNTLMPYLSVKNLIIITFASCLRRSCLILIRFQVKASTGKRLRHQLYPCNKTKNKLLTKKNLRTWTSLKMSVKQYNTFERWTPNMIIWPYIKQAYSKEER